MKIPIQRKFESEPEIFLLSILTFQPMQLQSSETVSIGNQGERLSKASLPSTSSSVFSALPFCSGPHSPTDQQSKNVFKMKEDVDFWFLKIPPPWSWYPGLYDLVIPCFPGGFWTVLFRFYDFSWLLSFVFYNFSLLLFLFYEYKCVAYKHVCTMCVKCLWKP